MGRKFGWVGVGRGKGEGRGGGGGRAVFETVWGEIKSWKNKIYLRCIKEIW